LVNKFLLSIVRNNNAEVIKCLQEVTFCAITNYKTTMTPLQD